MVDNANAYQLFEENLNVYAEDENFEVSTANDDIDSIKESLEDNQLVIVLNSDEVEYLKAELISNDKIDNLTYQIILQALNSTKTTIGMINSNIDPEILANISASITIDRTILNEEATTDENMDMVMSSVFPTLILPFLC